PLLEGAEGMYLARQKRALFFNAYADAAYVRLTNEVSTYERDIARFRRDVTAVDSDRVIVDYGNGRTREVGRSELLAEIAGDERKLREAKEKLRQHVNGNNASTTIHECVHQLSFHMGLLRADADTPHWLSEGIATLFESSLRGEVRDPGATNPERLATFRIARRTDRMIPLADLLASDGAFFSAAHPQAYAQSWVLTSFLLRERPAALRDYMAVVRGRRAEEGTTIDRAMRLRDFRAAFGEDLASFERSLSAYVDGL
ncbi:MAG TPA: DUF1570 domain-containing protein, partial [Candidatus Binatia bacterium]|nr:DUF1570 domain-containing protein [Candidatus Binatia bacterium]